MGVNEMSADSDKVKRDVFEKDREELLLLNTDENRQHHSNIRIDNMVNNNIYNKRVLGESLLTDDDIVREKTDNDSNIRIALSVSDFVNIGKLIKPFSVDRRITGINLDKPHKQFLKRYNINLSKLVAFIIEEMAKQVSYYIPEAEKPKWTASTKCISCGEIQTTKSIRMKCRKCGKFFRIMGKGYNRIIRQITGTILDVQQSYIISKKKRSG